MYVNAFCHKTPQNRTKHMDSSHHRPHGKCSLDPGRNREDRRTHSTTDTAPLVHSRSRSSGYTSGGFGGGKATRLGPGWRCRFAGGGSREHTNRERSAAVTVGLDALRILFISACYHYLGENYGGSCLHDECHLDD